MIFLHKKTKRKKKKWVVAINSPTIRDVLHVYVFVLLYVRNAEFLATDGLKAAWEMGSTFMYASVAALASLISMFVHRESLQQMCSDVPGLFNTLQIRRYQTPTGPSSELDVS